MKDEESRYRLLLDVYHQVTRLTEAGYDMLVPYDGHSETFHLIINTEDGKVVIKERLRRDVWRGYSISPHGEVKRSVWGADGAMTQADRTWLYGPLTATRLRILGGVLRSYTPCTYTMR